MRLTKIMAGNKLDELKNNHVICPGNGVFGLKPGTIDRIKRIRQRIIPLSESILLQVLPVFRKAGRERSGSVWTSAR